MNNNEQYPDSVSDQAIEDGEVYHHAEHGQIEATGICHQTQHLGTTHNVDVKTGITVWALSRFSTSAGVCPLSDWFGHCVL